MSDLKIKPQFQNNFVAFGKKGKILLKDRTQEDLKQLAIMALQSKDKTLLNLFEGSLPSLIDLQAGNTAKSINSLTKPTQK